MKQKRILLLASMAILMFGCKAQTSASEHTGVVSVPVVAAEAAAEKPSASQLLEPKLKKDMPYADLRKIVLADGWLPLRTLACNENVGGEATICTELPELDACSGDGHCVMWFAEGTEMIQLRIDAYGDSRYWNKPGRENEFNIKSWQFSSAMADVDKAVCPSNDFEVFLKAFARDKAVQSAFTLPLIKVEYIVFGEAGALDYTFSYVKKTDYKDFDLKYEKDGFHVVDGDEKMDPTSSPVQIKSDDKNTMYVKYQYGISEGNSYRFKKKEGCWYLAEDPDAPSP